LIKVGDKFNLNNENWEVIFIDNDSVAITRSENGEGRVVSQHTIYKNWYEQQKQRADELQDIIERFLYANRESDVYAICNEEELLSEYERIK